MSTSRASTVQFASDATIRQRCCVCGGLTWKSPVKVFAYYPSDDSADAVCENCLQTPARVAVHLGLTEEQIPTLAALERVRDAYDGSLPHWSDAFTASGSLAIQ